MINGMVYARSHNSEKLIRSVLAMARERGFEEIDARYLAAAADMPLEDVVRVFPDAHAVRRAVLFWAYDKLMTLLEHVEMCANDPVCALERIFMAHLAFIAKHPTIPDLLAELMRTKDQVLKEQMLDMIRTYEDDLSILICAARADGLVRSSTSPRTIATFFVTIVQGQVFRRLLDHAGSGCRPRRKTCFGCSCAVSRVRAAHEPHSWRSVPGCRGICFSEVKKRRARRFSAVPRRMGVSIRQYSKIRSMASRPSCTIFFKSSGLSSSAQAMVV